MPTGKASTGTVQTEILATVEKKQPEIEKVSTGALLD